MLRSIAIIPLLIGLTGPLQAADFSDPTWPCIQRKVDNLSLGLMWPVTDGPAHALLLDDDTLRKDITELSGALSLRRIDLEDLRPDVESFSARYDGNGDILAEVFATVFKSLNKRRTRIISGIGDFSLSQIRLAEQIDLARVNMDAELAKDSPDFDRIDALEEQIDWDQLIFTDRQRSIQYLCETPVIIERRLFGIAQMLQQAVEDKG